MDYDDVGNYTFDEEIMPGRSAADIAREIVFIIFCLVGVCADAAIIFNILRLQRVRTVPNILLANWAIADLCSLLVAPSGYELIHVLENISMSPEFLCGLQHFGSVLHLTVVVFVMIISADWFIEAYFPIKSETIRNYHRYVIGATWITSLLFCGVNTGICLSGRNTRFAVYLLYSSFWLLLAITIALQSSRAVRKYLLKRPVDCPSLMLTLATAFAGSWLLSYITAWISYNMVIQTIAVGMVFSNSIVNFTILYLLDKDFQSCLLQALKRPGSGYEDSIAGSDNPAYKNFANDSFPAKLSFDKQEEPLLTEDNFSI